jgi:hypothetical protein
VWRIEGPLKDDVDMFTGHSSNKHRIIASLLLRCGFDVTKRSDEETLSKGLERISGSTIKIFGSGIEVEEFDPGVDVGGTVLCDNFNTSTLSE